MSLWHHIGYLGRNKLAVQEDKMASAAVTEAECAAIDSSSIMTPEEEEVWLGKYFSTSSTAKPSSSSSNNNAEEEDEELSIDQQMHNLEKEFEQTMQIVSGNADVAAAASHNKEEGKEAEAIIMPLAAAAASTSSLQQPAEQQCAIRKVYSELHAQADDEIVAKLRLAMEGIPEGTKGLDDCRTYFSSKQHYTLQDILVAQFVLNDGLLMRQNHGTEDEYHVDIAEPLV